MGFKDFYTRIVNRFSDAPDRFELTVKEVYTAILPKGATAFDLGAHKGKHTLPLAEAVGPTGCVYAFEPIYEKFRILIDNIEAAGLTQVRSFNVCCFNENKIVSFTYLPTDPGKSSIHIRKSLEGEEVEKVDQACLAIRLDDFIDAAVRPAFMKIDIEGAELAALEGARALIERARPVLHLEIGGPTLKAFGARPADLYAYLKDASYDLVDILGNPLPALDAYLESVNTAGVYDYIAIPENDARAAAVSRACARMWA